MASLQQVNQLKNIFEGLGVFFSASALAEFADEINSLSGVTNNNAYTTLQTTVFPSDLLRSSSQNNFYMLFNFYQYQRPTVQTPVFANPIGKIVLPLPSNLQDSQSIDYARGESNPAIGAALDGMVNAYRQSGSVTSKIYNGVSDTLTGASTEGSIAFINTSLNTLAVKNGANKGLQVTGLAVNPYMTILFNAPSFKRHIFTWKFIPNNQQEADTLKYIINKFKYHALPDTNSATAGTLLQYPDMVRPIIAPAGYTYSFKYCVIEKIISNYSPGNSPSFVGSVIPSPSAIEFTIELLEIEYFLKKDLRDGSDLNYNMSISPNIATTNLV